MQVLSLKALEETLKSADSHTRHRTLRAVASLFLESAPQYSDDKIEFFDDVFGALLDGSTHADMLDISRRMAPVENAPRKLIKKLAENPEISIAGPVLSQSPRLSTSDLCDIARSKGSLHMLAISHRSEISEPVTDILLERGDECVARTVVGNAGARLSNRGIGKILHRGKTDQALIDGLQRRPEISEELISEAREQLADAVVRHGWMTAMVEERVKILLGGDPIGEAEVKGFASKNDYEGVVASLSILGRLNCEVVANMMQPSRVSGTILVFKALGFAWGTVDEILRLVRSQNQVSSEETEQAHRDFVNMTRATAERIIRFWQIRQSVTA